MVMKKWMAMILAAVMMFGGTSVTAFAASGETETQAETTVAAESSKDVNDTADVEDSKKESETEKMTEAEVQEQIQVTTDKDGKVTFSFGDWEWTAGDTESVKTGTVTDVSSYLHLRNGAGMSYDIIGHLLPGAQVEVVGEDGDWYKVVVPEQTGYVHSDYLTVLESTKSKDVDEEMLEKLLYMMMLSTSENGGKKLSLTPDGNMTLVDDIGSSTGEGQQFITFVTKSGNTFYMIIDRNDKGEENVHFLNLVDEADLLALMDEDAATQIKQETTVTEPVIEEKAEETEEPEVVEEKQTKKKSPVVALLVLFLAGVGGVGGFLYVKMNGKKKVISDVPDPDADYRDDEEEAYNLPEEDEDEDIEEDEYLDDEEDMEE
ncbi:MAG: DUF4366 domain-containing protein [Eubacteriales bacterium]|nr:DUF4366 domain-containing protein [Eubacteriales bacterium]